MWRASSCRSWAMSYSFPENWLGLKCHVILEYVLHTHPSRRLWQEKHEGNCENSEKALQRQWEAELCVVFDV